MCPLCSSRSKTLKPVSQGFLQIAKLDIYYQVSYIRTKWKCTGLIFAEFSIASEKKEFKCTRIGTDKRVVRRAGVTIFVDCISVPDPDSDPSDVISAIN